MLVYMLTYIHTYIPNSKSKSIILPDAYSLDLEIKLNKIERKKGQKGVKR